MFELIMKFFDLYLWIIPIMIIGIAGYTKNVIIYLIGILLSIALVNTLFINGVEIYFLGTGQKFPLPDIVVNTDRNFFVGLYFLSSNISVIYSLIVVFVFSKFIFSKNNNMSVLNFSKNWLFYMIIALSFFIDNWLDFKYIGEYYRWRTITFNDIFFMPTLIVGFLTFTINYLINSNNKYSVLNIILKSIHIIILVSFVIYIFITSIIFFKSCGMPIVP